MLFYPVFYISNIKSLIASWDKNFETLDYGFSNYPKARKNKSINLVKTFAEQANRTDPDWNLHEKINYFFTTLRGHGRQAQHGPIKLSPNISFHSAFFSFLLSANIGLVSL